MTTRNQFCAYLTAVEMPDCPYKLSQLFTSQISIWILEIGRRSSVLPVAWWQQHCPKLPDNIAQKVAPCIIKPYNMLPSGRILFHLMRKRQKRIRRECATLSVCCLYWMRILTLHSRFPLDLHSTTTRVFLQRHSVCFLQNMQMSEMFIFLRGVITWKNRC